MVANAHKEPGEDGMKMFNIGYLAGVSGILLAWNGAIVVKVLISDDNIAFTDICLNKQISSGSFYPVTIAVTVVLLCVVFSVIISLRTKSYLGKLQDRHLRNLPSKNVLTFLDTQILFFSLSLTTLIFNWSTMILIFKHGLGLL